MVVVDILEKWILKLSNVEAVDEAPVLIDVPPLVSLVGGIDDRAPP